MRYVLLESSWQHLDFRFAALEPTSSIKSKFQKPFKLAYTVTLADYQLTTQLQVTNPSPDAALEFQALFHNYVRAPSDDVLITGLENAFYFDKTATTDVERDRPRAETRTAVDVRAFTDSVYQDPQITRYYVNWPGHKVEIRATNLPNVVVWNPHKENAAKMADMEKGGWSVDLRFMLNDLTTDLSCFQGAICLRRTGSCARICILTRRGTVAREASVDCP